MLAKLQKFIVSLLDPNGVISFGRFMALISAAFVFGWDSANLLFAWRFNYYFPDKRISLLPDVATAAGQLAFCLGWYGLTKWQEYKKAGLESKITDTTA